MEQMNSMCFASQSAFFWDGTITSRPPNLPNPNVPPPESASDTDKANFLAAISRLADLNKNSSTPIDGERLYARIREIRQNRMDVEHPDALALGDEFAELLRNILPLEAEALLRHNLVTREATLDHSHPIVANTPLNLGRLYATSLGRYADAEALYLRALAIREKVLGYEHGDVAATLERLIELYQAQLRYEETDTLYRRALAIREKAFGPDHRLVGNLLWQMSLFYDAWGRAEEARLYKLRAIPIINRYPFVNSLTDERAGTTLPLTTRRSYTYLGSYIPAEITNADQLPVAIQQKLTHYLIDRLGEDYYRRLSFVNAQLVDFDELKRINPGASQYQWEVFAYSVAYRISDLDNGIAAYEGTVELNANGKVIGELQFPFIRQNPEKARFVSLASARLHAIERGMAPDDVDLRYSTKDDALVFGFRQQLSPNHSVNISTRSVEVSAHTGEVLRDHTLHAIR
jgi:tetratricopeptide (TPR) repeat protein